MNMKRLLSLVAFFATVHASAQQVNPVPDYVFRNQMSVGRNAVTDTAAYFSIGPRYGATKGFMPPIVGDTATFSSGKRNGLLIFSVQKNKFLYWDSVRVQWSDMAGSSGSYIVAGDTAAMLAPYLRKVDTTSMLTAYLRKGDTSSMLGNYVRHAGYGLTKSGQSFLVDTLNIATRAWRQKGIDSVGNLITSGTIGGSGSTNYVPKFTATKTLGNSLIYDDGINVGIGTATPAQLLHLQSTKTGTTAISNNIMTIRVGAFGRDANLQFSDGTKATYMGAVSGNLYFGNSDKLEVIRLDTLGNVGINTTTPSEKLHVLGNVITTGPAGSYPRFISSVGSKSWEFGYRSGTTNFEFREDGTTRFIIDNGGEVFINTDTDAGDYKLQVSGNIYNTGSITTGAPSGGSIKPWKIGEAATVSPTSPNRTIRVEIDGTVYYLHAKTTND